MSATTTQSFQVVVDPSRLVAHVRSSKHIKKEELDASRIRVLAAAANLRIDTDVNRRIDEFVALAGSGKYDGSPFVIAQGKPARPGQPAAIFFIGEEKPAGVPPEYESKMSCCARLVSAGDAIGRIQAPVPAEAGCDVFGAPIPVSAVKNDPVALGPGVKVQADGQGICAEITGRVIFEDNKVEVRPIERIEVSGKPEGIIPANDSDLFLTGVVPDGAKVSVGRTVIAEGPVEAAVIEAGQDLLIRGGAIGRSKGLLSAGRDLAIKFCSEARLSCGRDLYVSANCVNTNVRAGERIIAPTANFIGGEIWARRSVFVQTLGSNRNVPTQIRLGGAAPDDKGDALKLQQTRRQELAGRLAALSTNVRGLSPSDRERMTELAFELNELDAQIKLAGGNQPAPAVSAGDGTCLRVSGAIHEAVTVIVGDRTCRFDKPAMGPLRIELQKVKNATEMVLVNERLGTTSVLKAQKLG